MSVSPVDPSNTQPTLRLLDRLHQLELCADDPALVSEALNELRCQQLAHIEAALSRLLPAEGERLRTNLGGPSSLIESEAKRILTDALTLESTYDHLCDNYDPMLKEIAMLGYGALKNSARYTGRERTEELNDSLRLLKSLLAHPIGSRNFAAWFECGWVQWSIGNPLTEVEESFYQASRLSGGANNLYHLHALRHLAFIQAGQNKWQEASDTLHRVLASVHESVPTLWIEAARYSLRCGHGLEAQQLIERALDVQPELAFTLFADPDLEPLYPTCLSLVERFAQLARQSATVELNRLQVARTAGTYLSEYFGLSVKLPEVASLPLTAEGASLFEAHKLSQLAHHESIQLFGTAITAMEKEHHTALDSARRLKAQIDQAISEKTYYEGSIKNVEDHARESGFSLHPYNFSNPFLRRRNQKADEARFAYESFKLKLTQAEDYLREHLPHLEAAMDKQETRAQKAQDAQKWLQSQLASE